MGLPPPCHNHHLAHFEPSTVAFLIKKKETSATIKSQFLPSTKFKVISVPGPSYFLGSSKLKSFHWLHIQTVFVCGFLGLNWLGSP